jgi:hypothetical protein
MKLRNLVACALLAAAAPSALAYDQIIRPFQSARSAAMGGVKYVTGLYEENFWANPARVTHNPKWKITLFDPTFEVNSGGIGNVSKIINYTKDKDVAQLAETTGNNNHLRFQTSFPAVYIPPKNDGGKWAFAVGLFQQTQVDMGLRRNYQTEAQTFTDVGPAFTVGRRLLPEDRLSVGVTAHATYRIHSKDQYGTADLLAGRYPSPTQGADGMMVNADVGATWQFPFQVAGFKFSSGVAINNVLGGKFGLDVIDAAKTVDANGDKLRPREQPRTYNAGLGVSRDKVGPFSDFVGAFEISDVGNNPDGSLFRTLHIGGEARLTRLLIFRAGINQGYLCAGAGLDLKFVTFDLSTYGEEMGLNTGTLQDRRYALKLAFQI